MPGTKQDLTPMGDTQQIHHGRMPYDAGSTSNTFMRMAQEQHLGHQMNDLTPSGAL